MTTPDTTAETTPLDAAEALAILLGENAEIEETEDGTTLIIKSSDDAVSTELRILLGDGPAEALAATTKPDTTAPSAEG